MSKKEDSFVICSSCGEKVKTDNKGGGKASLNNGSTCPACGASIKFGN